jgi:hypothetical protein
MPEFNPLVSAPSARDFAPTATALGNAIGNFPTNWRQGQEDALKLQLQQQLANLFPNGVPLGPDGQPDIAAIQQALAKAGQTGAAINLIPDVQQQAYGRQIMGGGAPGGAAPGAPMTYREPTSATGLAYGTTPVPMDYAKNAVGKIESDNNYGNVTDSRTRHGLALGRYQIMQDELPQDLANAGLPPMNVAQFLRDPTAQDRVFEHKFGGLMRQYGNANDAVSAWLTGRPLATAGTRADRFGTTGYQHALNFNRALAGYGYQPGIGDTETAQAPAAPQRGATRYASGAPIEAGAPPITSSPGALAWSGYTPPEQARGWPTENQPVTGKGWPTENLGADTAPPSTAPRAALAYAGSGAPPVSTAIGPPAFTPGAPAFTPAAPGGPRGYSVGWPGVPGAAIAPPPSYAPPPPASAAAVTPGIGTPPPATTAAPPRAAPAPPPQPQPRPLIEAPDITRYGYRPSQWREAADDFERRGAQPNMTRYQSDFWANLAKRTRAAHEPFELHAGTVLVSPETGRPLLQTPGRGSGSPEVVSNIADGIESGHQPPSLTGLYGLSGPVRAELQRRGFDLAAAQQQWQRATKMIQSLDGPQMIRFAGLANSVLSTIDEARTLSEEMDLSGVQLLNRAELTSYMQTRGNTPVGQLATRYVTAINTLKEEFSNLANGGYAPTEATWKLANDQLNSNYGRAQLGASLDEIQKLIRYRVNAIPGFSSLGPSAPNRYVPGAPAAPGAAGGVAQPSAAPPRIIRYDAQGNRIGQ